MVYSAPAHVVKEGAIFDLAIALGLSMMMGVLPLDNISDRMVFCKLAMGASIQQVLGGLSAAIAAVLAYRAMLFMV